MLIYINTEVLDTSLLLKIYNIYRSNFLHGEVIINMKLVFSCYLIVYLWNNN